MSRLTLSLLAMILAATLAACNSNSSSNANKQTDGANTEPDTDNGSAKIIVLSNRADLISGGDALIEIVTEDDSSTPQLSLNGVDISEQLARRDNGRIIGLITGLALGDNTLQVRDSSGSADAVIRNHPNFGPVFSAGQHRLDDWETCAAGQPSAQQDCNIDVQYRYFYKSTNTLQPGLIAFDPDAGMPSDIATTTTDQGETLPFIVRREDGFQDRDRYSILQLFKVGEDWTAWQPQSQWNRKLLIPHGANCGMSFSPGQPPLTDAFGGLPGGPEHSYVTALGRGFAVMSTALNNNGHNCDVVLQAESMMMAKERLIEQYGELRYTIGTGCSGGAIAQQTVANAYPGIYQGLLPTCAYPDSISPAVQAADYNLMRRYFETPSEWASDALWSPHQFGLVEGHISHANAVAMDELLYKPAVNTAGGCLGDDSYHPQDNPDGVRCGAIEWYRHIWGTQWLTAKSGDRQIEVTKVPAGNKGIQYGLQTLQAGQITPAQFVDLNVKIGGFDFDMQPQIERSRADENAIAAAFHSGAGNVGNHLDKVAIINFVGPDPAAAHDAVHAWWTRWRLDREHGHHDNHVMWAGPVALVGDPYYFEQGLLAMDRWLAAIEADPSAAPLAARIVANKPADIHDQCSDGLGHKVADEVCVEQLRTPYAYGTPRTVAGADHYATNYDCRLRPFSRSDDYGPLPLSEAQWLALETLFADGVCDYSQPGLGEETKTASWLSYQDGSGDVVVGGAALPAADLPAGWASAPFSAITSSK
ncbi:DUF6351 family protein [Spongiibacter sp.]|uniref:DUF6351 family protein n=1 Tax=Spongiibacter sp. TaxID=2024860 RepID=UPI0035621F63